MAGGTFTSQNKTRPGAYINFEAVLQPAVGDSINGIVTMPVAMSWGAEVTEILSTDLVDGKSVAKIGFSASDAESLLFREALKNCYKAVIYRLDTGGTAATALIGDLDITAKYAGIVGNDISVSSVVNGANFDIITFYKGGQKDIQTVADTTELVSNDWVAFSGTTNVITASAGVTLTGGLNGSVVDGTYLTYRNTIKSYAWNIMGIPYETTLEDDFATYVDALRDDEGRKVQVVLYDATQDNVGIINVVQGYTTSLYTVSPTACVAYVAGLCAGSEPNQSNTYHVIKDATSIVYPAGVTAYTNEEVITALKAGQLVLSTRQDGAVVIEQDINTFHTFTADMGYTFSKNRVVRTLDEIANSISLLFVVSYIGKVTNNDNGRNLFKADVIGIMNSLQDISAIKNFAGAEDISIYAGVEIDSVTVDMAVQPLDAMEKLYMTVTVG
jgi:hypothetical protein